MNSGAVPFGAGLQRAAVSMQSLELWQQRRMNVQHAAAPLFDEPGRQQPHEAGEAYDLDAAGLKFLIERALERFAIFAERMVVDDGGCDAVVARAGKSRGVGNVR